jgi:sporulation protein YlmC with PRC-barrel domain
MSLDWTGFCYMSSHRRAGFVIATSASLISSAVLAQALQPGADPTTTAMTAPKWMTQEVAGQWRASKLIGLNVYNHDNEKIGGITELIVDKSGKLDAVVVGAGGFLGLGEHDVAIPYSQITWMPLPGAQSPANPAIVPSGAESTVDRNSEGAHPSADKAFIDAASARPYPDHAVINATKEQLKAAPAFKFSR